MNAFPIVNKQCVEVLLQKNQEHHRTSQNTRQPVNIQTYVSYSMSPTILSQYF